MAPTRTYSVGVDAAFWLCSHAGVLLGGLRLRVAPPRRSVRALTHTGGRHDVRRAGRRAGLLGGPRRGARWPTDALAGRCPHQRPARLPAGGAKRGPPQRSKRQGTCGPRGGVGARLLRAQSERQPWRPGAALGPPGQSKRRGRCGWPRRGVGARSCRRPGTPPWGLRRRPQLVLCKPTLPRRRATAATLFKPPPWAPAAPPGRPGAP